MSTATSGGLKIDSSSLGMARFAYNPAAKDIGHGAVAVACDISKPEDVARLVKGS